MNILQWFKNYKDAIAVIIAISSILITGLTWSINYGYQQYVRISVIEKNVADLRRAFESYHRTFLLTELVKIEQDIELLKSNNLLDSFDRNRLIDLLVKREILLKEIEALG
jgi:hypothetical protein